MGNKAQTDKSIYNLKSRNPEILLQTIDQIRVIGNAAHFVELLELLHETNNQHIKKQILKLFSDLKSTDTIPFMIEAIQNKRYADELKELLNCCWQNGLNYSSYLPLFIDLVIKEEFLISFEAFTVIENMYGKIDKTVITQQLEKINNSLGINDEQKKYLLNELKNIIPNLPEKI